MSPYQKVRDCSKSDVDISEVYRRYLERPPIDQVSDNLNNKITTIVMGSNHKIKLESMSPY